MNGKKTSASVHPDAEQRESEFYATPEQMEIERRWPVALRELSALIDRIKDISRGNPEALHKNHKAHLIHKELVFELATAFYLSRGTIFSAMKLFDTPYTICSCPTPENGGGCTLTNWYYWGGSNTSLLPNDDYFGRRMDDQGNILPCRHFPVRSGRECLGCGCNHEEEVRSVDGVFRQADDVYEKYVQYGRVF